MDEAGFTPGPWMMAAKPSSIVGWPVVACGQRPEAGRQICTLNYADKAAFGGPQPGDRKFNLESEANGRLIAAAPRMHADLVEAERMFRWYGDLHAAKPDPEKAARNYEMADRLAATIALARNTPVSDHGDGK